MKCSEQSDTLLKQSDTLPEQSNTLPELTDQQTSTPRLDQQNFDSPSDLITKYSSLAPSRPGTRTRERKASSLVESSDPGGDVRILCDNMRERHHVDLHTHGLENLCQTEPRPRK